MTTGKTNKKQTKREHQHQHRFLWLAVATTGANVVDDVILEVALALVEDGPGGNFDVVTSDVFVLGFDQSLHHAPLDAYVARMHTENDLLTECEDSDVTHDELDEYLCTFAKEQGAKTRSLMLAGPNPNFARLFLESKCKKFGRFLAPRTLDVSVLVEMARATYGDAAWPVEPRKLGKDEHRATTMLERSLEDAAKFRAEVMVAL